MKKNLPVFLLFFLLLFISTEKFYAQQPVIITPDTLDFGNVYLGTQPSPVMHLKIKNNFGKDLTISMSISDGDSSYFNYKLLTSSYDTIPVSTEKIEDIQFTPGYTGLYQTVLYVYVYELQSGYTIYLTGNGAIQPLVVSPPDSLKFGWVKTGISLNRSITLTNNSPSTVTISDYTFYDPSSAFSFLSRLISGTILPHSSKTINIQFTPPYLDNYNATLTLFTNTLNSPITINLSGTSILLPPVITPDSLNFGRVALGYDSTRRISIYNPNKYLMPVYSYVFENGESPAPDFQMHPAFDSIPALKTINIDIKFAPVDTGEHTANLYIAGDYVDEPHAKFVGVGAIPPLVLSSKKLDFGDVLLNNTKFDTLTVTNSSTVPVTISDIKISSAVQGEFKLSNNINLPAVLQPGNSIKLIINYSPVVPGIKTGTLTIFSNTINQTDIIQLGGNTKIPALVLSDQAVNFGNVFVNESISKKIKLINKSTAAVTIEKPSFIGDNKDEFSLGDASYPKVINPNGDSLEIGIVMTALSAGSKSAAILIPNNTVHSPDTVKLNGNAGLHALTLSTRNINFGNVFVNESINKTIKITNNSKAPITIQQPSFIGNNKNEFALGENTYPKIINPNGDSLILEITYKPISPGNKTASLLIPNNTVTVQDTIGLSGSSEIRALTISTRNIKFGDVFVNESLNKSIKVTNNSQAVITIQQPSFIGANKNEFSLGNNSYPKTLNPGGDSLILEITYKPVSPGNKSASLLIPNNTVAVQDTIGLSGSSEIRALTISTRNIKFGNVFVNESLNKNIKVTNNSQAVITIQQPSFIGVNQNEFSLGNNSYPKTINPGGDSLILEITYKPLSPGNKSAALLIPNNTVSIRDTVELSGSSEIRALTIPTRNLAFGNVFDNEPVSKKIKFINNGQTQVTVQLPSFTGNNKNEFSINNSPFPKVINPGGDSLVLEVIFNPVSPGNKNAFMLIPNSTLNSPDTISLSGVSQIRPLSLSNHSIDFGNVIIGKSSTREITLFNRSKAAVTVNLPVVKDSTGEFKLNVQSFPKSINAGDSLKIDINFNPLTEGIRKSWLLMPSNSVNSPDTIKLQGTGIYLPVVFSDRNLDFGEVNINTPSVKTIKLVNNNTGVINIQKPVLDGDNKNDFNLSDTLFPKTIQPNGGTLEISIIFSPKNSGARNAWLMIPNNTSNGKDTVFLRGTGKIIPLAYSVKNVDFGKTEVNKTLQKPVKIKNNNNTSIIITNISILGLNNSEFSILSSPGSIKNNDSSDILIKFSPSSSGVKQAYISINNSSTNIQDSIGLSGSSVIPVTVESIPPDLNQSTVIKLTPPGGFNFTNNHFFYRLSGDTVFSETVLNKNSGNYEANIPAEFSTIRGIQYYASFSDGSNTITYPLNDPENNPASIQTNIPEIAYQGGLAPAVFRMVSIPLYLSNPILRKLFEDSYGSYSTSLWRVFRWDPLRQQYLEYSSIDSTLLPGISYWLITKDGKNFNIKNAHSVNSDSVYTITLLPGYNQISNPFAFDIAWNDVINSKLVNLPIRYNPDIKDYDSVQTTILKPWEGYWVYNDSSYNINLKVLPNKVANKTLPKYTNRQQDDNGFIIQIKSNLETENIHDNQNYIGMNINAKDGQDKLDILKPPPVTDDLDLSVLSGKKEYAKNLVALKPDGAYWMLKINSRFTDKNVSIKLHEKQLLPAGFKIWFLDLDKKILLPLIKNSVSINMNGTNERLLKIITGTEDYAKNISDGIPLLPSEYALFQNFPNPFNPETNIYYSLKENSLVTLEIFDILGRKIKTLLNNELQDAGLQNITWNGTNSSGIRAASGIYIYQLKANNYTGSKKMVLLK